MKPIILFDGNCGLCHRSVQFIIQRDPAAHFRFAPLKGATGQALLKGKDINSIVLMEGEKFYFKSSAVLKICGNLKGPWKLLIIFRIVPKFIRDFIYDFIAKNRYKWFGKETSCLLPAPDKKERFLD